MAEEFLHLVGTRVLVVDDEPDIIENITSLLEPYNMKVSTASNGLMAFNMAKLHHPEVIISDLVMSLQSGAQFIEQLRLDGFDISKVIVYSGNLSPEGVGKLRRLGVNRFIAKPAKAERLLQEMTQIVQGGLAAEE